jgi:hypothetical protein
LEVISEEFKEIEAVFEMAGFLEGPIEAQPTEIRAEQPIGAKVNEENEDDEESQENEENDQYDEGEAYGVYEREEIEVAVDVFLSELVREGVIAKTVTKPKIRSRLSLVSIFDHIFGPVHEISKLAKSFEEDIEGYFGVISYKDMCSAYHKVLDMRRIINSELAKYAQD